MRWQNWRRGAAVGLCWSLAAVATGCGGDDNVVETSTADTGAVGADANGLGDAAEVDGAVVGDAAAPDVAAELGDDTLEPGDSPTPGDAVPTDGDGAGSDDGATANCIIGGCSDGNPCTVDSCDPVLGCQHQPEPGPCSDGNACTQGDKCADGACQPGPKPACDDGNPCSDDACDPGGGVCVHLANAATCTDANTCTAGDTCQGGVCAGTPVCACKADADCDDKNPCTTGTCTDGACAFVSALGTPCDDGNACSTDDKCQESSGCVGSGKANCDDQNPCTDDGCTPVGGCTHAFNNGACDDGSACTTGDVCAGGTCGGAPSCACTTDGECNDGQLCTDDACVQGKCTNTPVSDKPCNDGAACTKGDSCAGGLCVPGLPVQCEDGTACAQHGCDTKTGQCVTTLVVGPCSDGDACTAGDACKDGKCAAGGLAACDDANPCTTDSCDIKTGCVFTPAGNGNVCSAPSCQAGAFLEAGSCFAGFCMPGAKTNCDDGNPCTTDACDAKGGGSGPPPGCVKSPNAQPCDDGTACTVGDACKNGSCIAGAPLVCDDGNACTIDACDPQQGCAKTNSSDGNICIAAACKGAVHSKASTCSAGVCVPSGGPTNCDDKNPCTDDVCSPTGGCSWQDNTGLCEDGNACTANDGCLAGICNAGTIVICNDNNPCTDDKCDFAKGCVGTATTKPCDDASVCTQGDACAGGKCVPGAAVDCDDKNPCTDDTCDAKLGCQNVDNKATCDDGNACNLGDVCAAGKCAGKGGVDCDDKNACTSDTCDLKNGCVNKILADGFKCVDAACGIGGFTGAALCLKGVCEPPPAAISCSDGNPCTGDVCNPSQGCLNPAAAGPCDDNDPCTKPDACQGGACAGAKLQCDDGNPCTDDSCGSKGCLFLPNAGGCEDGDACTSKDLCANGKCIAGPAVSCDDLNGCTDDSCDKNKGCVFAPNSLPCDDASTCTTNDACAASNCTGLPLSCDDLNPCTVDTCDPKKGCVHSNASDGSQCAKPACAGAVFQPEATCQTGTCIVPKTILCDDLVECTTDTCDVAAGCKTANKPWGTSCKALDPKLLDPFCAGTLCTGFEPLVAQPGGVSATRGGLSGIDRVPGGTIYASAFDNTGGNGVMRGAVVGIGEAPLSMTDKGKTTAVNSRMNDIARLLAVGGGEAQPATAMGFDAQADSWSLAKAVPLSYGRPINGVDSYATVGSGTSVYVLGGDSDASNQNPVLRSTVARASLVAGVWSTPVRMFVTTAANSCDGAVPMAVADVFSPSHQAIFLVGNQFSNGNRSLVAFHDGNTKDHCGQNMIGYSGEAYVNDGALTQDLRVDHNAGSNPPVGPLRGIHGTGASNVMVVGNLGTVFHYASAKWTQLVLSLPQTGPQWGAAWTARSVWMVGNEAWLAGDYSFSSNNCRSVFVVHGQWAAQTATWTWNKAFVPVATHAACNNNQSFVGLARAWVDAATGSAYFVGSVGTSDGGTVTINSPAQSRPLLFRVALK